MKHKFLFQCANVLCDLEENLKKEIRLKLESKGIDTTEVDLSDNLSEYELESRLVKDLDRRGYLFCCQCDLHAIFQELW